MEAMEQEAEKIPATVVTALARAVGGRGLENRLFRGALTPVAFGDAQAELRAAFTGAIVHDLGWRRRIEVTGEDRLRWLGGMVTNHVAGLAENTSNDNLVLNAQGRIQGNCCVRRGAGMSLDLEMDEEQRPGLTEHLERFIIMDDVELKLREGWTALGVAGPQAEAILQRVLTTDVASMQPGACQRTALRGVGTAEIDVEIRRETGRQSSHWELWCREENVGTVWRVLEDSGAQPVGCQTVEQMRIVEGVPAYGVDFGADTLPQEAGMDETLHFSKGCYLGQEIVERIHSRGQVHRHVRRIELIPVEHAPVAGMKLCRVDQPEKPVAKVTSVACVNLLGEQRWYALGMVRAEAEMAELQYLGGRARVLRSDAASMSRSR